jgi:hypothetical protein
MIRFNTVSAFLQCVLLAVACQGGEFTVDKEEGGVTVKYDGKLVTRYVEKSGNKPILWPLIDPNGHEITRAYPMVAEGKPGERQDHVHHRSFWFDHGDVNGISFWDEGKGSGTIVHRKYVKLDGGKEAVIATVNDWIGEDGVKQCEDLRTIAFAKHGDSLVIDYDITVKASTGKVTFGDTKEGSFGVRVAGTMKVDAKQGGKIINSEGEADAAAWGKPASWVDYHGPVEGETVGIAILNHPSSFRYPTHWHVRTYGLFAANPFGLHDFSGKKPDVNGAHSLEPGDSFTLKYRVLVHQGDEKEGKVAEEFERYAKGSD